MGIAWVEIRQRWLWTLATLLCENLATKTKRFFCYHYYIRPRLMNSHGRIRFPKHERVLLRQWEKPPSPSSLPSINLTRVLFRSRSSRNRLTSIFVISIWQTLDINATSKNGVFGIGVGFCVYRHSPPGRRWFLPSSCLFLVAVNVDDVKENWKSIVRLPRKTPSKTVVSRMCRNEFYPYYTWYREHTHADIPIYYL